MDKSNKDTFSTDLDEFSLIYGAGGIWCGLYNVDFQLSIFKNSKLKKCLILPSTFHNCDNVVKLFDERFVVYCRDPKSLEYCKSLNNTATFKLHCDLAFTFDIGEFLPLINIDGLHPSLDDAIEKVNSILKDNKWGIAPFMRNDKERSNTKIPNQVDLPAFKIMLGIHISKQIAHDITKLMLYVINRYNKIITDRLHVAILSYRLDKDIELYDNSYGKVYNVAEWSIVPNQGKCKMMQRDLVFPRILEFNKLFEHSFVISRSIPHFQDVDETLNSIGIFPKMWQAAEYCNMVPVITREEYGIIGCSTSHMSIVKLAEYMNWDCVAIFEEDCCFSNVFNMEFLKNCLQNIPQDCDAIALGYLSVNTQSKYFSPIEKINLLFGSHAYILFNRGYEKYQKVFAKVTYHTDRVLEHLNTYVIYPSMFGQKKYSNRIHKHKAGYIHEYVS